MDQPLDPQQQKLLKRMEAIMLRLPRTTREIFLAHRLDDMPYEEIARRTGLSVRQVERHMAKAIYKIARDLDEEPCSWWRRWF